MSQKAAPLRVFFWRKTLNDIGHPIKTVFQPVAPVLQYYNPTKELTLSVDKCSEKL